MQPKHDHDFAVVFDVDGVLVKDDIPIIPHAPNTFEKLQRLNIPFLFVTNGGGETELSKAKKISKLFNFEKNFPKLHIRQEQIILSHTPWQLLEDQYKKEKRCLYLCRDKKKGEEVMREYGFENVLFFEDYIQKYKFLVPYRFPQNTPEVLDALHHLYIEAKEDMVEKVDAIFIIESPVDWQTSLQVLLDILKSPNGIVTKHSIDSRFEKQHADLFFCNPDVTYGGVCNNRITQGAFRESLQHLFHRLFGVELNYYQCGKPYEETFIFAEHQIKILNPHFSKGTIYMIGDNPLSDIKGANKRKDWFSILVRTGIFQSKENDKENPAKHIANHVEAAIDFILQKEGVLCCDSTSV